MNERLDVAASSGIIEVGRRNRMTTYKLNFVIPAGQTGATGQTGDQGPEPVIEIGTVTTGQPGTDASVTITTQS